MERKEHKGGILTNQEVERDNMVKGKNADNNAGYSGIQDTGDQKVRGTGNEVQENDGLHPGNTSKK